MLHSIARILFLFFFQIVHFVCVCVCAGGIVVLVEMAAIVVDHRLGAPFALQFFPFVMYFQMLLLSPCTWGSEERDVESAVGW